MLTSRLVKVRFHKNTVTPYYLSVEDELWQDAAAQMIEIYREGVGCTRGEIEQEWKEAFGDLANPLQYQGLAKLLEDRSEFEVVSGQPPESLRAAVFLAAAKHRQEVAARVEVSSSIEDKTTTSASPMENSEEISAKHGWKIPKFHRDHVLNAVATELGIPPESIEGAMFADLRTEQRLTHFKDITPEHLLERYNVGLAQAILFKANEVNVVIKDEPPQRYRQLLRLLKFHRLIGEFERVDEQTFWLKIDGPLSLFSATQKYGLQLALFLPALLKCKKFELEADIRWGPQRTAKKFKLSSKTGLISHYVDSGMYVPPELSMFVELFTKKAEEWEVSEETELIPLGQSFWVPDYQLIHKESGQIIYLEILGFWRRSSVEKHLDKLKEHAKFPFVLAISKQLNVDDASLDDLSANVIRFREMPLPKDVIKAASALL